MDAWPFKRLPTAFTVTQREYVFLDDNGREAGTGRTLFDGITTGVHTYALRTRSIGHVTDIMDVMSTTQYPEPGSLGWATALEDVLRGESVTVTDADGWPTEITADFSDGGLTPPPLPPDRPIAWELNRDGEVAIATDGRVWLTDTSSVESALHLRLDDCGPDEGAWRAGAYGRGDNLGAWADAERKPVAWARSYPGGRQTVIFNGYEWAGVYPRDLVVAVAWAAHQGGQ